ncbi:MAG: AAA family ATPase [Candidatus Gracilibacteria bacterium]|nr:AAA family ATPase [Candidatus Gracilibacteria bacterium]
MQKTILALAGEMGCGKGTLTRYLVSRHNAEVYRFSNPLRDILDRMHRETSRDHMQQLSTALRQVFGDDILSEIILADVGQSESPFIVIDGVRRESDIKYLRNLLGFKLIYIDADLETRYTRITFRGENTSDTTKTIEEFIRETEAEAESRIRGLKEISDIILENNGTIEDLEEEFENAMK